jgi:hypothetical protein
VYNGIKHVARKREKGRVVLGEREGLALIEDRIYDHTDVKSL